MIILGLDLGVGSVGWALIETDNDYKPLQILGMGSRIVRLSPDENTGFDKGNGESVCSLRTSRRTARKTLDRFQMRRSQLKALLSSLQMYDPSLDTSLSPLELWGLRAKATTEKISLQELGRVLLHLNKKRGYNHAKSDIGNAKETEYVARVNQNFQEIQDAGQVIGEHFYSEFKDSMTTTPAGKSYATYSIKNHVFPRKAYLEEFNRIMDSQQRFYPDILNDVIVSELRNIIFYQRPLKSCKHLVNTCEFMHHMVHNTDGTSMEIRYKVAPKSSPLAQVTRIWESINNIRLVNIHNRGKKEKLQPSLFDNGVLETREARLLCEEYILTLEERQKIFQYLNNHEKMTESALLTLLGIKGSGFKADKAVGRGIQGNTTLIKLKKALGLSDKDDDAELSRWTRFDLNIVENVDPTTGEIVSMIDPDYIKEPLYDLWHTVYSSNSKEELTKALKRKGISDSSIVENLYAINFSNEGYTNRSAKFMRYLLPLLMDGLMYSEACEAIGINHSNSITKDQNTLRELKPELELLTKNSLRQPVVEKILNQMINVVNLLIKKYGPIDEARIELARQLRQTKEQRARTSSSISKSEKENKQFADSISELNISPSRRRIQKYRLWLETGRTCIYCGQPVTANEFLESNGAEIEHIIPRSLFFDDSMSNKVCSCRKCNHDKGQKTGYEYMSSKSEEDLTRYINRVEELYKTKAISKTKRDRLLTPQDKIPTDFLNRDLTLSQYIAKKAVEILKGAIRDVWVTSGAVTDFLRHSWGYDNILHNLNIERYALADKVHDVAYTHNNQTHVERRIDNWTKRLDHRHHAIDALTIALTRQSYIQRLNNLNSLNDTGFDEGSNHYRNHPGYQSLTDWAATRDHFSVAAVTEMVDRISVSFKSGKKLTTPGKRYVYRNNKRVCVQQNLLIPRGSLHEESIYGKIKLADQILSIDKAFENASHISNPKIKAIVEERIRRFEGDIKKCKASLKKESLSYIDKNGNVVEIKDVRIFVEYVVIKYNLDSIKFKNIDKIVDPIVREVIKQRFAECKNDDKTFIRSLNDRPLILPNGQIVRSVRCKTGLKEDSLACVRHDESYREIGYAKYGNNDHVVFYRTAEGQIRSVVVPFWIAVKRKLMGLPSIIKDPTSAWDIIENLEDNAISPEVIGFMPDINWTYLDYLQMNDMVILGMSDDEFNDAVYSHDLKALNNHLYCVRKISLDDYHFRHHIETTIGKSENDDKVRLALFRCNSYNSLIKLNPHKVRIDAIGNMTFT